MKREAKRGRRLGQPKKRSSKTCEERVTGSRRKGNIHFLRRVRGELLSRKMESPKGYFKGIMNPSELEECFATCSEMNIYVRRRKEMGSPLRN